MEKSLQLRKQKALDRARVRRRLARGELRLDQISMAAKAESCRRESPLILRRVKLAEYEG